MAFVREVIPEEYWGMLKELGVYDDYIYLTPWIADKERGIYLWVVRGSDREDPTTDYILIWQNTVVYLNVINVDRPKQPAWADDNHTHLQKGLIRESIKKINIPKSLASQGKALINVIRDVFQSSSDRYDIELTHIAMPEVREEN